MQLLRDPESPDAVRIIVQKILPESRKSPEIIPEYLSVCRRFQAGMIQTVPFVFRQAAAFRIAVYPENGGVEIMDRHDSSPLTQPFGEIGTLRAVDQFVVCLG